MLREQELDSNAIDNIAAAYDTEKIVRCRGLREGDSGTER